MISFREDTEGVSLPLLILVTRPVLGPIGHPDTDTDTAADHARVAGPGFVRADAAHPQLSVLDLGATRGDGVFETVMVSAGRAPAIDAHLERFGASAALLDLPEPDAAVWRAAFDALVEEATSAFFEHPVLAVKLVLTRGVEGSGLPTGWLTARPAPDFRAVREHGVRVVTLDRGYRHDVAATSPWLLQGAKTLSYALNSAALREAARRDADDVIFISSDGFVLEAPTASVLVREGDRILTPTPELGILPGTTQRRAFAFFAEQGLQTGTVRMRASELARADAVWLVSSVRQAVPVIELDGSPRGVDAELTAALNRYLAT